MKSANNSHINSNYMQINEQKSNSAQSSSDCRTPIAWHNRNINLSQPITVQTNTLNNNYSAKYRRSSGQRLSHRPSSPSATTTSSDDREEVPMVRHPPRRPNSRVTGNGGLTIDRRHQNHHQINNQFMGTLIPREYSVPMRTLRSGTLRSTKSVPALTMSSSLEHDPCPVHGNGVVMHACHPCYPPMNASQTLNLRRFGSIADIRDHRMTITNTLPFLAPIPENKQSCGLMPIYYPQHGGHPPLPQPIPPPNSIPLHLLSHKMQTRPMLFPAYSEPIQFRNQFKVASPVPSTQTVKINNNYENNTEDVCCRGHLIVLWIILGVVTVGVISGIILAVTMN